MSYKLNLGCGMFKKEGYINVDIVSNTTPDILCDLNKFPYPFHDDKFTVIEANHVLEHLYEPFKVMKELYRISQHKGIIIIRVPHFSRGFTHPEHKRGFDVTFPYYFNPDFKGGYQGFYLKLEKMRLRWFAQEYLKKDVLSKFVFYLAKLASLIIDFISNLSPFFTSRILCFLVGGFEEIEFYFRVLKRRDNDEI